ncbi:hypothetical protein QJU96_00585 [Pasteurella skyensis]|uniref:alpha/beta hydrolase family protein n=1 Tax=Phocoenobacter skyensis TaxID=97481 RepID=UPI0027913EC0|nr:hypothetical protein [Pasteurella skyensis]MDP8169789.1 hypothetical protein [Pasteurella skyensis]
MKKNILIVLSLILFTCFNAFANKVKLDSYYIGFKKINIKSEQTSEAFPVALVYPTNESSKIVKFGHFKMNLSVGANIADGKFPLIIVSHGSGESHLGHKSIAFELVKNGYIVGMPLHPNNNFRNNSAEGTIQNWKNRPLHIKATINSILSNNKILNHINVDKIGIVGHSAGGYTALAAAGGKADTSHIINLCINNPKINEPFCGLVKENKLPSESILNIGDKRIKALVLMAPVGILFKSENALSNINIPTFLLRAEKDQELTEPYQSTVIAQNYKNKELLIDCTVPNAGHYSFITPFPDSIKGELGIIAQDPKGFDRKMFHKVLSSGQNHT